MRSRPGGAAGNAYDDEGRLYTCEFRERRVDAHGEEWKVAERASRRALKAND